MEPRLTLFQDIDKIREFYDELKDSGVFKVCKSKVLRFQ